MSAKKKTDRQAAGTLLLWFGVMGASIAFASETASNAKLSSTNISVDSTELEPFSIDKATDPEGRPTFYTNGNMAIGFNEDGDPNVATRF